MFKKISLFLFSLIFLFSILIAGETFATDSSATISVNYTNPIIVTEIRPYSFTITKKPGETATSMTVGLGQWNSKFQSVTAQTGCFKVTGDPSASVRITSLTTGSVGPVTFSSNPRVIVADNCDGLNYHEAVPKTFTLNESGEKYIVWGIAGDAFALNQLSTGATISNLTDGTYTGTASVSLQYQ